MKKETRDYLFKMNNFELAQSKNHQLADNVPAKAVKKGTSQNNEVPELNNYFFNNHDIYLSKHNRFAPYPAHKHAFLEMNYCFAGHCKEHVNGKLVTLNEGDLILLDVGCVHSVDYLCNDDILINILFRDKDINIEMLNELRQSESVLFDFLINRITNGHKQPSSIIFRKQLGDEINITLDNIIDEYVSGKEFSNALIKNYLNILLIQLIRSYKVKRNSVSQSQELILKILNDLTLDFATTSLNQIAQKYCYNKNYLSNLFKEEVGENFSTVLTRERLIKAHYLIETTDISISDIVNQVGISNLNFFYKKYKEMYEEMPKETRLRSIN